MMTAPELAALLRATEQAHAASGHAASGWAEWYAQYMLPKLVDHMEQESELAQKQMGGWNER